MKRNLTGYQFGIYWTRLNVNKALSISNGNVCITFSIQNIDYKKWENQMVNVNTKEVIKIVNRTDNTMAKRYQRGNQDP
jgi:hypothetical protein